MLNQGNTPWLGSGFSLCLFNTMEYITDQTKFLSPPLPHPIYHFYSLAYLFLQLRNFFDVTDHAKGSTQTVFSQRCYFCARRVSKIVVPPKEMLPSFSILRFFD